MGRVGIEPTTLGLKVPCSAAELPARSKLTQGIKPSQSKGSVVCAGAKCAQRRRGDRVISSTAAVTVTPIAGLSVLGRVNVNAGRVTGAPHPLERPCERPDRARPGAAHTCDERLRSFRPPRCVACGAQSVNTRSQQASGARSSDPVSCCAAPRLHASVAQPGASTCLTARSRTRIA
jgi:hypothetical protein